jgi:hypothetical protein
VVALRRGLSSLGCLVMLLLVAVVCYFGVPIGEHFFRFYDYQDTMRQEARLAGIRTDTLILRHLRAKADSLDLPPEASDVTIRRDGKHIEIESEYFVHLMLPATVRDKRFNPRASAEF